MYLGEKNGVKVHAQLDKFDRKVHDSYEKQIRKLEITYKNILHALEAHKFQQIFKLRQLQASQKELINKAKVDLDDALLKRKLQHREKSKSKTPRGSFPVKMTKSPAAKLQPNFDEGLMSHGENLRTNMAGADNILELPLQQVQRPDSSNSGAINPLNIQHATSASPTVSKTQLIRQFGSMTWQGLQFATFHHQKIGFSARSQQQLSIEQQMETATNIDAALDQ